MDLNDLTSGTSPGSLLFRRNPDILTVFRGTKAEEFEVLAVNDRLVEATGWTPDEFTGRPLAELLHPDVLAVLEAQAGRLVEVGDSTRYEVSAEVPAGRRTYDSTIIRLEDVDGAPHFLSVGHDITEARRAREALDETQAMSHIGHWTWDLTTHEARWSDEVYRIYGWERQHEDELIDVTRVIDMVDPEDRPGLDAAIRSAIEDDVPYEMDMRLQLADGEEKVVVGRGLVVRDAEGLPIRLSGTIQDVTAQRATEAAVRRAELAAEQQRQALELNDDIVQGLATLRLAIMADEGDEAMRILDDTIDKARTIISHLLDATTSDRDGIQPGDLVRERSSSVGHHGRIAPGAP